ncbi:hypothetical protein AUJ14_02305 [Candidatus Micrarchaeota archaeon CG1_02_55_22]|nr:MAG: hypothetical protein AUJ14_02305 [Candidatus Micrarchaeota archaeon CG1_02_55_22]
MELTEQQKKDLTELQSLQQQMQMTVMQKQQLLIQKNESGRVLEELGKADDAAVLYRFAGPVLVSKKKADLIKEIEAEKETYDMREGIFSKQEARIKERALALQKSLEATIAPPAKK